MHDVTPPPSKPTRPALTAGFTLIELSVVLVIIGLIVGGIVVGQSLIAAAALQAQITQIQKFNTAANTFREKCGYLPGDTPQVAASACGLQPRGQFVGEGDGNGVIEGVATDAANEDNGKSEGLGESVMFWEDLSVFNLIEGSFTTASSTLPTCEGLGAWNQCFPDAKIGNGSSMFVWSTSGWPSSYGANNYFGIEQITLNNGVEMVGNPSLTVQQAYAIDKKIDDGLPMSGGILAIYNRDGPQWAGGLNQGFVPYTSATAGSSTTCFDNGGGSGPQQYSMGQNSGSGVNCALSFKFQ